MNAPAALPDVATHKLLLTQHAIDWVGMNGIALPGLYNGHTVQMQLDISVNLPNPSAKGIHMSRLYQLAQTHLGGQELSQSNIQALLSDVISSHSDIGSSAAKLSVRTQLMLKRPALLSDREGWKFYPLTIDASTDSQSQQGHFRLGVSVDYSSTCPCSAALARQLLQQAFLDEWQQKQLTPAAISAWLAEHGSYATPHSQRSQAQVRVSPKGDQLAITELIDHIENALGTPVQTAVKREDEQAFARLNGQNLMYVEDAVRRLQSALKPIYTAVNIDVTHRESLHQHDAVASISNPISISS